MTKITERARGRGDLVEILLGYHPFQGDRRLQRRTEFPFGYDLGTRTPRKADRA